MAPSYALVGIDEHDRIELPEAIHQALTKVVAALHAGKAVTIAPQTMTLTTQQAADLLGVSRPTVVRLINDGVLPAERIGNRHRLLLDDVLSYRDERRNRQYNALGATGDIDSNDDPETTRKQLREARAETQHRGGADTMGCDVRRAPRHLPAFARNRRVVSTIVVKRNSG